MTITAAVDGSSLGNPGPAGWAWVIDADRWDAGGWPEGTNNLGELTAVLEVLKATEAAGLASEKLHILADSQYAINVVTKWRHSWKKRGWTKPDKKPIKNLELIQEIDRVIAGRDVEFEWVKGHAGHSMNERADDLARGCAEAYQEGRTPAPGPGLSSSSTSDTASAGESGADTSFSSPVNEGGAAAHSAEEVTASQSGTLNVDSVTPVMPEPTSAQVNPEKHSEEGPFPTREDVESWEKRFISAWVANDIETLDEISAHPAVRVWPDGRATVTLNGPVPPGLKVSLFGVTFLDVSTVLVQYRLSWDGGQARELSIWTFNNGRRPALVHHQSTIIAGA